MRWWTNQMNIAYAIWPLTSILFVWCDFKRSNFVLFTRLLEFKIGNRSWSLCFIVSFISRTLAHLKFFTMHLLCILALQSFWIMHIQIYVRYDWYFSYCSCKLVVAKPFFSNRSNLIMYFMIYNHSCNKGRFSLNTS